MVLGREVAGLARRSFSEGRADSSLPWACRRVAPTTIQNPGSRRGSTHGGTPGVILWAPPVPRFGGTIEIMRVTIQLPDDISAALQQQWDDVPRRSLEAIAVEAYRTGALTGSQVRRLLGLESRFQVHALLKEHHVPLQYTAADLEDDLQAQRELGILPGR